MEKVIINGVECNMADVLESIVEQHKSIGEKIVIHCVTDERCLDSMHCDLQLLSSATGELLEFLLDKIRDFNTDFDVREAMALISALVTMAVNNVFGKQGGDSNEEVLSGVH